MVLMRTIDEIRHENFLVELGKFKTIQAFADQVDRAHSQISQLKHRHGRGKGGTPRRIDDKLARQLEEKLGLERGHMDNVHTGNEWPFPLVDRARWDRLTPDDQLHVQRSINMLIGQYEEPTGDKPHTTGTGGDCSAIAGTSETIRGGQMKTNLHTLPAHGKARTCKALQVYPLTRVEHIHRQWGLY